MSTPSTATAPKEWGGIRRWLLLSAVIVVVVSIFQFGIGGWPGRTTALRNLTLEFLVCFAISGLASTITPLLNHWLWRYHVIFRWVVLITALAWCGAAGLSFAIMALSLLQVLPSGLILTVFRENIVGVTTVTLIVGTSLTIFASAKMRLTEIELQTQRLERERSDKIAAELPKQTFSGDSGRIAI